MISPLANIWGGSIGEGTSVGAFCDLNATIGENCKIQTGVSIPPGWTIGNRVFIAPKVTFCNDTRPDLSQSHFEPLKGIVEEDAVIGAAAVILPGITIGKGAFIGAGSVVTKSVPPGVTVVGNPARNL